MPAELREGHRAEPEHEPAAVTATAEPAVPAAMPLSPPPLAVYCPPKASAAAAASSSASSIATGKETVKRRWGGSRPPPASKMPPPAAPGTIVFAKYNPFIGEVMEHTVALPQGTPLAAPPLAAPPLAVPADGKSRSRSLGPPRRRLQQMAQTNWTDGQTNAGDADSESAEDFDPEFCCCNAPRLDDFAKDDTDTDAEDVNEKPEFVQDGAYPPLFNVDARIPTRVSIDLNGSPVYEWGYPGDIDERWVVRPKRTDTSPLRFMHVPISYK